MRRISALLALACLSGLAVASASRGAAVPNDLCDTCKTAVHVMKDMLCDPEIEGVVVDWVIGNLCPASGNKQSCADIVNGVAPALFDWLRLGTDDAEMCSEVGVCGKPPLAFLTPKQPQSRLMRSAPANDMTCPLCMFVVGKVKEQLSDPITRQAIHDRTTAACEMLPAGGMRDTCTEWANKYEETIFSLVDKTEADELCALLGSCSLAPALLAQPLPPLSKGAAQALAPVVRAVVLKRQNALPSNDNCETCKTVVAEMHSALANPDLQAQVVDYAKAACGSLGSLADSCKEHVDQYAPMAFGMVLAYLQPEQVCRQLKMCPPPSLAEQLLGDIAAAFFPGKFEPLLLQGRPLLPPHAMLRLPRT